MKVIAINGKSGSGKSMTAQILRFLLSKEYNHVVVRSFAAELKRKAQMLGWNNKKDGKGRSLLQDLGKILKNYYGQEYFAESLLSEVDAKHTDVLIIDDLRFMSELLYLCCDKVDIEQLVLIHIDRNVDNSLTDIQKLDISENDLNEFDEWDVVIDNNSNSMIEFINKVNDIFYPQVKLFLDAGGK